MQKLGKLLFFNGISRSPTSDCYENFDEKSSKLMLKMENISFSCSLMQLQPISTREYYRIYFKSWIFSMFPTYDFLQIKTLWPQKQS